MFLMEQPFTIVVGGLVLTVLFVGGLFQTGRRELLYASIAVVLMTAGLVVLERFTVTPSEEVKATLFVIANDLKQNDVDVVVSHVSEGRPQLRREAEAKMQLIKIVDVDIKRNLKVKVYSQRDAQLAEATFNAVIRATDKVGWLDDKRPVPRFFTVRFKKETDGKWRIRDYEMEDPRAGLTSNTYSRELESVGRTAHVTNNRPLIRQ